MNGGVRELACISRNTADLDRALAFYRDALGFQVDAAASDARPTDWPWSGIGPVPVRCAGLTLGGQHLALNEFPQAAAYPPDSAANDLWFQHCAIVVADMAAACRSVLRHGATPITREGPQTLPPAAGSVTGFKFRDPDGHPLELLVFPPDHANSQQPAQRNETATLGIDHSAISVDDIERSITFYTGVLGFTLATRQTNRGPQQDRLDALDNVEVEVAALQPAHATPHIELLAYRHPRGRARPKMNPSEIAADHLALRTHDLHATIAALAYAHIDFVTHVTKGAGEEHATIALRDPDGHWLVLTEQK